MKLNRKVLRRLILNEAKKLQLNETMQPMPNDLFGDGAAMLQDLLAGQFEGFVAEVMAKSTPKCMSIGLTPPFYNVDQACIASEAMAVLMSPEWQNRVAEETMDGITAILEELGGSMASMPQFERKVTPSELRNIIAEEIHNFKSRR